MKILVVDDSALFRAILKETLERWGYDVICAKDGNEAWEILKNGEARIVLTDWIMPGMSGIELCRMVRQSDMPRYIYIIILTVKNSKKEIIDGLSAGADDYLIKPIDYDELRVRLSIGMRILNLEERLLEANKKIEELASLDALTGLLNRRYLMQRIESEIQRATREKVPLSLIISDIDKFKSVNDIYGHQVGDRILKEFAKCLISSVRVYDVIGRYGGEEFIIVLPGVDVQNSIVIAERLRENVEALEIDINAVSKLRITASFGISTMISEGKEDIDSLIKKADEALYFAKQHGRNKVCHYDFIND